MLRLFRISLLALAWIALHAVTNAGTDHEAHQELFQSFMLRFGKSYRSAAEFQARFKVFTANVRFIDDENSKGTNKYELGVTEFADMTRGEFRRSRLAPIPSAREYVSHVLPAIEDEQRSSDLPDSVDWRKEGAVTKVKNQGECLSSWAFATTGALEAAWMLSTGPGKLVSLSEQQLVDCIMGGCEGGGSGVDAAFSYVAQNGLETEANYNYSGVEGVCNASLSPKGLPAGRVQGFRDVKHENDHALMQAVSKQPVSVAIEADTAAFQLYKSGVITGDCGASLDHAVLLVGYGSESGVDYWLIKNSWGPRWGLQGFGKILRGAPGAGECGIKMQPSYPVIAGSGPSPTPSPSPSPHPPHPHPPHPSPPYHYEKPPCRSDEVPATVQDFQGVTCVPPCKGEACPQDVPPGTSGQPQCVLQDSSTGKRYCAITCLLDEECPPLATCRHEGLTGLCLYSEMTGDEPIPMSMMNDSILFY